MGRGTDVATAPVAEDERRLLGGVFGSPRARRVEMLEAQAREVGMRPTVLARHLIRVGLAVKRREEVAYTVTRLQQVVDELRALVG